MDDISMEKKMKLVQQIRTQYHQNQYDLSNREQILYGKTSYRNTSYRDDFLQDMNLPEDAPTSGSLKIRTALACMLFMLVILCDSMDISFAGIDMQQIFQIVAADYQENVDNLIETLSADNILE